MKLAVKRIKQSVDACSPTAYCMVMQYFGDDIVPEQFLDAVGGIKNVTATGVPGTINTENAFFARRRGFKVDCFTYNMRLLSPLMIGLKGEQLRDCISENDGVERLIAESSADESIYFSYVNLLDEGANLFVQRPRIDVVKKYLKKSIPVILNVNTASFYECNYNIEVGHSIVAIGYEGKQIIFNDPSSGEESNIKQDHLLFALSVYAINRSAYMVTLNK
jgi:hypothetical protein